MGILYYEKELKKRMKNNCIRCLTVLKWDLQHNFKDWVNAGIPIEFFENIKENDKIWVFCSYGNSGTLLDGKIYNFALTLDKLIKRIVGDV